MILKTYNFQTNGIGSIVIDDDASDEEIANAMLLDATEEHGNGRKTKKEKENTNA